MPRDWHCMGQGRHLQELAADLAVTSLRWTQEVHSRHPSCRNSQHVRHLYAELNGHIHGFPKLDVLQVSMGGFCWAS